MENMYRKSISRLIDLIQDEEFSEALEYFYIGKFKPLAVVNEALTGKEFINLEKVYNFLELANYEKEATLLIPFLNLGCIKCETEQAY